MESKLCFSKNNVLTQNVDFNFLNSTITIKDKKDYQLNITYIDNYPSKIIFKIVNSQVTIIENYENLENKINFEIDIDKNSDVLRLSLFLEKQNDLEVIRIVNNKGNYKSLQFDLANFNIKNFEEINLNDIQAKSEVFSGIYASYKNRKDYQTKINHLAKESYSKCKIFGVCDDFASIKIFTDSYIKNGASLANAMQEGRIINLKDSASGIVLPNLHIDENDVMASHSCSVGSVNLDHLYYLQSRGFSESQARNLLVKSYFTPILQIIEDEILKERLAIALDKRIDENGC